MSQYLLIFILVVLLLTIYSCATLYVPTYKGEKTDHFDGRKFYNPGGHKMGDFRKLMKYNRQNKRKKWEFQDIETIHTEVISDFDTEGDVRFYHINHATMLVQMDGINILTDPVYFKRASPFSWAGPKRYRDPGIPFDLLPRIDVVVISHDHYDHLDVNTLKRLAKRDNPQILAGLGHKKFLKKFKLRNVEEMDWGEAVEINGVEIHFEKALHWSNRAFSPRKTLWGSYMFIGSSKVYFAGDTAYENHFSEIKEKFQNIDLALIPVGAYTPRFFMLHVHMDPEHAVKSHLDLDPRLSYAIHWGTFQLTHEGMFDPVEELDSICQTKSISNFIYDRVPGKGHQLSEF